MRYRVIIVTAITILFQFSLYGQHTKELRLSLSKKDFFVAMDGDQIQLTSAKNPIQYGTDFSEPGLPYVIVHYLIGGDEEFVGVEPHYSRTAFLRGVKVKRNPKYRIQESTDDVVPLLKEYTYENSAYPSENIRYTGTHRIDGYRYITFLVCPFIYQPQQETLDFLEEISLSIRLKTTKGTSVKAGRAMRNTIKSIVANQEDLDFLYPETKIQYKSTFTKDTRNSSDPFDYLIITADSLKDSFQRLADWKTRKGVPSKVITKEYIDSTYGFYYPTFGEYHDQLIIKTAIRDYYENHNVKYVLLGGDDGIIPSEHAFLKYCDHTPNPLLYDYYTMCDLYYACLDGRFDWNLDMDTRFGEYEDGVDCHPSLPVSRLSVCSNSDAQMQIERIIDYERNPILETWNDSVLMMGCAFNPTYRYPLDGLTDVVKKNENMVAYLLVNDVTFNKYLFYDTKTSHPSDSLYDVTVSHFKDQLAKGFSIVQIDTHGNTDSLRMETPTFFFNHDAMDYNNPNNTMIITSACLTNNFKQDCLSEAFMRNPNGGIISYWGGSHLVVQDIEDQSPGSECNIGPIDELNLALYLNLYALPNASLGDAVNAARLTLVTEGNGNIPYDSPHRWNLFSFNLLGDPEMHIRTIKPDEVTDKEIIPHANGDLELHLWSNGPFKVCVMSLEDNGASYYHIDNWDDSHGIIALPYDINYSICITSPHIKPYIINCYKAGYVQNDTIAHDVLIWSDQAQVGRDVTTLKSEGPVVVEDGTMLVMTPHGVTFKNNFELRQGAKLIADPSMHQYETPNFP